MERHPTFMNQMTTPRLIYRFNVTLIKISTSFFCRKVILKFRIKMQGTQYSKTIFKKNKDRSLMLLSFITCYSNQNRILWFKYKYID